MNWFLLLVILLMGGGGFYEYQTLHGQVTVDELQLTDLKTKLQDSMNDAQKSADHVAQLTLNLADAQSKATDLAHQLQVAKAAAAAAPAVTPTSLPSSTSTTASSSSTGPTFTTKLGTITALDGKVYTNCQLMKVSADNIVVNYADGITQIPLNLLPATVQKSFGFDARQGALSDDQVLALEQKRQAAMASGN